MTVYCREKTQRGKNAFLFLLTWLVWLLTSPTFSTHLSRQAQYKKTVAFPYPELFKSILTMKGVVAHAFNHRTWKAKAGQISVRSKSAWSTEWIPGQPGLHRETLSWKNKQKEETLKSPTEPKDPLHSPQLNPTSLCLPVPPFTSELL